MTRKPEIATEKIGDCVVTRLSGCLDHVMGESLLEQLKPKLSRAKCAIIDLAGVKYLDSSGLGALVAIQMTLKRRDGNLILTGLQGAPLEVMRSSQLVRIFQVRDSLEVALKEVNQAQGS